MAGTSRRGFLKTAVSAAAGWWILQDSRSAWTAQANERLNLAVVGLGNRGTYHLHTVPRVGQNLVAVCDADKNRLAEAAKQRPNVPQYQDFRKMLDELDRKLDGLIVATPEHTHAVISARAMARGKHVFCEKPIAHDVAEARALRRIAKETGRRHADGQPGDGHRLVPPHRGVDRGRRDRRDPRGARVVRVRRRRARCSGPRGASPCPSVSIGTCGSARPASVPITPSYEKGWGGWRDFSTGCLGGGGSHSINLAFKAFQLRGLWEPGGEAGRTIRVETEVSERCPDSFPRWQIVRFHIPQRGALPPATIHWYNAPEPELVRLGVWQRLEKIAGRPLEWKDGSWTPRSGTLLVGSKGVVHTNAHNSVCAFLPERDFPKVGGPPQRLPHVAGHERDWFQACRGGPAALSSFDHSGPAMELLLLGNVASLVDGPLEFDPVAMKIVNHAEADALLRPEHREGWSV